MKLLEQIQHKQSLIELILAKISSFEKSLITTYDIEQKWSVLQKIQDVGNELQKYQEELAALSKKLSGKLVAAQQALDMGHFGAALSSLSAVGTDVKIADTIARNMHKAELEGTHVSQTEYNSFKSIVQNLINNYYPMRNSLLQAQSLITQGNLKQAIVDLLETSNRPEHKDFHNNVMQQSASFYQNENAKHGGGISHDNYTLAWNKVKNALNSYITDELTNYPETNTTNITGNNNTLFQGNYGSNIVITTNNIPNIQPPTQEIIPKTAQKAIEIFAIWLSEQGGSTTTISFNRKNNSPDFNLVKEKVKILANAVEEDDDLSPFYYQFFTPVWTEYLKSKDFNKFKTDGLVALSTIVNSYFEVEDAANIVKLQDKFVEFKNNYVPGEFDKLMRTLLVKAKIVGIIEEIKAVKVQVEAGRKDKDDTKVKQIEIKAIENISKNFKQLFQ